METFPHPRRTTSEHPSTYIVQDHSNKAELIRLDEQDRLFTACMGGVLPEQPQPVSVQRVLDVGCGPGWWLIETARTSPAVALLVGVDISTRMIAYASAQAEAAQMSTRVQFQTGDALRMLEFPNHFFGLVNQRFGMSWLRKLDWPKLLREYQRVCRPGGVIRITESGGIVTNSPALGRLQDLFFQALDQAGHLFAPGPDGIIAHLAAQMETYGIDQVQTKTYHLAFHTNQEARQAYIEDVRRGFRTTVPFLQKWIRLPKDYEHIYQQMVHEIAQPEFEATQTIRTAWGKRHGT